MSTAKHAPIREAATVILVRPGAASLEVLMVRRHPRSSFMSSAFVFPGGAIDAGESPTEAAARELSEEAGVTIDPAQLQYFAHWVTPSVERKRFSARFYVGMLPEGQSPAIDRHEAIDMAWVTPDTGLARAAELCLPPPQIRSLYELAPVAASWSALLELCRQRAARPAPVLPRAHGTADRLTLLLPWDPEYRSAGVGDEHSLPAEHPQAHGPSRFVHDGTAWQHISLEDPA